MPRIKRIEVAAGTALALISTEHYFSAGLSSPLTTRKFLSTDPADIAEVQRAVKLASTLSVSTGAFLSVMLRTPWPVLVSLGLVLFYANEYKRALAEPAPIALGESGNALHPQDSGVSTYARPTGRG